MMKYLVACGIAAAAAAVLPLGVASAEPAYCYSTGQWVPWPDTHIFPPSACPDGQAPFNGPGPMYGGGNHRWPSGEDD